MAREDETRTPTVPALAERLLTYLVADDRRAAAAFCRELVESGTSVAEVVDTVLAPAMRRVGELWEAGVWSVVDEHVATGVAEWALSGAVSGRTPSTHRGPVLVACAEHDWHSLPTRMVAEALAQEGWDVRFLGASLPLDDLVDDVRRRRPRVALLGCAIPQALPSLAAGVAAVQSLGVPVVVGGRALGDDDRRARALGAAGWAPDARSAARLVADPPPVAPTASAVERLRSHAVVSALVGPWVVRALDRLDLRPPESSSTSDDLTHLLEVTAVAGLLEDPLLLRQQCHWVRDVQVGRAVTPEVVLSDLDALLASAPGDLSAEPGLRLLRETRIWFAHEDDHGAAGSAARRRSPTSRAWPPGAGPRPDAQRWPPGPDPAGSGPPTAHPVHPSRLAVPGLGGDPSLDPDAPTAPAISGDELVGRIVAALRQGHRALVLSTPAGAARLRSGLGASDLEDVEHDGRLVVLDVGRAMAPFLAHGVPDAYLFSQTMGARVRSHLVGGRALLIWDETVSVLASSGHPAAARRLQDLWEDLRAELGFELLLG